MMGAFPTSSEWPWRLAQPSCRACSAWSWPTWTCSWAARCWSPSGGRSWWRWEALRGEGVEAAAPDGWEPGEGEDGGFEEVPDGV